MSKDSSPENKKVVMVSGGFDPVHIGHVRMFSEAKKLGDELVVVLNNDHWLRLKKGFAFMPEADRKEIIESFKFVDRVLITMHQEDTEDISVCREIELIRPHIFANGGDRKQDNIPEYEICRKLGIEMVFNVGEGGKVRSSSELVKEAVAKHKILKKDVA
jgi:D-beta-D-heptose 7-phosphate kinase/D-beta-D-heptose 1-phosphate adenosyltransferase